MEEVSIPGEYASREEVLGHLTRYFSSLTSTPIGPDDDYFALGLIDSLRSLEIVVHVEKTFSVSVDVEDLDLDNFRTASRVADFVLRKRSPADAGPEAG